MKSKKKIRLLGRMGSTEGIEMPHLKHIKTINLKLKGIEKEMAAS
jgi:hypothetical protein